MKSLNFPIHLFGNIKSMHRFLFLILFVITNSFIYSQQLAFPTAKGAGAYTTGGRGGTVIQVTNLNDSGTGSLRAALETTGSRTIVFTVGGIINLSSILYVDEGDFTIAGQTAPDGGITIDGDRVYFENIDNAIVRYIRFRGGHDAGSNKDSFTGLGLTNCIFDHCSASFGSDESMSLTVSGQPSMTNVTMQRCLLGESNPSGTIVGGLSGSYADVGDVSVINNLWYNIDHRFPNISGNGNFDVINNVAYHVGNRAVRGNGTFDLNHIGNYYDYNNNGIHDDRIHLYGCESGVSIPTIRTNGNKIVRASEGTLTSTVSQVNVDNTLAWKYFYDNDECGFGSKVRGNQLEAGFFASQRALLGENFTIQSADDTFTDVKADVGCNARLGADGSIIENKDAYDTDALSKVSAGTITSPLAEGNYGVASFAGGTPYTDTDADGMADTWEATTFGDLTRDGTLDQDADGYTDLEEFLNLVDGEFSDPIFAEEVSVVPETATINIPETIQLTKEFTPANTTNQNGIWSSSNTSIATVSSFGFVTPVSEGDVIITFTSNDGGFSDSSVITVTNIVIPVSDVSISPNDLTLDISETVQLTANFTPSNATNLDGFWASSNTDVVIIDDQGTVNGLAEGTATITFTSDDNSTIFDTSTVNVIDTFYGTYEFYNADTDVLIQEINGDEVFDINVIGDKINFRSIPQGGDDNTNVESIMVEWTGVESGTWIESEPIYAGMPNGHVDFNFEPYTVLEGIYNFTVTYYSQDDGSGDIVSVDTFSLTFFNNSETVSANAGEDKSICENESVTLTASGGPNYLWSTGETTQSIVVSPLETTTYTVTVSNDQLSDSDDVVVTVNPNPIANAGEERAILSGDSIPLTATGGSEFLWSTGETTQEIIVSPIETTTYTVEVFENGCSDIASVTVIVGVSASVGGETTICQGESTTLYANGGSYYLWSTGQTTQSIDVSPSQTSTYSVVVSNNSSSDEAEITVNVNLLPAADAGEDVTIESGQNALLTAAGGNTYLWSNGETTQSISVSPSDTSIYTVETFVNGCSTTDDVKVTVVQQVNANAGQDMEICFGESATLTASGGAFYLWSTGEETPSISVVPDETTTYTVEVSNGFSSQTADVMVGVLDCQAIGTEPDTFGLEFKVYPNPTDRIVNIKLVGLQNVSNIFISDMTGKVISSESIEHNDGYVINKQYDFTSLTRGIYLITFKQIGEPAITKKLILQ